ncbi:hypothetical protein SK128_011060, partial [Halocaridina rubra]
DAFGVCLLCSTSPLSPFHPSSQSVAQPSNVHPSESFLPCEDGVRLARLRCGPHPALLSYQKWLEDS